MARDSASGLRLTAPGPEEWFVDFDAVADSPHAGESFRLRFRFPPTYPIEPPEVVFVGRPPLHPHVYSNGFICLSLLYDGWSAALTVAALCRSIISMLASAREKRGPANDRDLCRRAEGRSPKDFIWEFEDDTC